jgi:dTDP-4-dehydrorhamnose 3,5-epimerase
MSRFITSSTPLLGLIRIERQPIRDRRGSLTRIFCAEELASVGWNKPIAQINHTCTQHQGTVRGLHYQLPPCAEMKLVSCLRGEIWDVAVDLRRESPTFLQWYAERLSAGNSNALLIPEGFAHGFQALTDGVEIMYCTSAPYAPSFEQGLHPQDSSIGISWPLTITELSDRDANHPKIDISFNGIGII